MKSLAIALIAFIAFVIVIAPVTKCNGLTAQACERLKMIDAGAID